MALEYIDSELSEAGNTINRRTDRQVHRAMEDPFDLSNKEFISLYRLSKDLFYNLIDSFDSCLEDNKITALSAEKQVLSALRFYATECFQRVVGEQWRISMSQASISRSLHRVTDVINDTIFCQWVKFPCTPAARNVAWETFVTASNPFAGAIGALDRTHVAIIALIDHEVSYVNRHGYHFMNVQMICDIN